MAKKEKSKGKRKAGKSTKFDKKTSRGYQNRNQTVNSRNLRKRFLIVCEGEKTEPNYFLSFRVPREVIDVRGIGANTISLVKEAIKIRDKNGDYDEVWCVFDRDSFPIQNFNAAIDCAKDNDIEVAYSNETFEIWYLLHFDYRDTAMSRSEYETALTERLRKLDFISDNQKYRKNSETMYDDLYSFQKQAIKRAEKLLEQYQPIDPARNNPSTTVHLLVKELNKEINWD